MVNLRDVMWFDITDVVTSYSSRGAKTRTWTFKNVDPNSIEWSKEGYYSICPGEQWKPTVLSVKDGEVKLTLERVFPKDE